MRFTPLSTLPRFSRLANKLSPLLPHAAVSLMYNSVTGPVVLTSFTSTMLLKRTRPQAQVSTGTAIEILKLGSLLDAYRIDRIGIPARKGLSRRGCSTTLIRSRKAPHTLLGHCRPPDHERKPQSESWRVGITAISPWVSYPPCVIDSFVPFWILPSL